MLEESKNRNKNVFDGLIIRLYTGEEGISELKGISIDTSQTETNQKKRLEKQSRLCKNLRQMREVWHNGNYEHTRRRLSELGQWYNHQNLNLLSPVLFFNSTPCACFWIN